MAKILIYAMKEGMGGVEQYVLNLSKYSSNPASKYGYIIIGGKTIYENELKNCGVDYFFVTDKSKSLVKNIAELNTLLKECRKKYDTFYCNTSGLYYPIPYILAHRYKYKIIIHSHLTEVNNCKKPLHIFNRYWINKVTCKQFACSTPAAEWMFGKKTDLVHIIPNAIEINKFLYNTDLRKKLRKKLNVSDDTFIIGNVGRLSVVKNQKFLLCILQQLKVMDRKYKLILVGDGEMEAELIDEAKRMNVENDVIFYGKTSEPYNIMNVMDCIVMPSLTEGFPISLVEAQAAGLECLVSDVVTKEINISGHVKFKALKESPYEWATYIDSLAPKRYDCSDILTKKGYDVHSLEERVYKLLVS